MPKTSLRTILSATIFLASSTLIAATSSEDAAASQCPISVAAMAAPDANGHCTLRPLHIVGVDQGLPAFFIESKSPLAKLKVGEKLTLVDLPDTSDCDSWVEQIGTVTANEVVDEENGVVKISLTLVNVREHGATPQQVLRHISSHPKG